MRKFALIVIVLSFVTGAVALASSSNSSRHDCSVLTLEHGTQIVHCNDGSSKLIFQNKEYE